jgi:hypothetical protein
MKCPAFINPKTTKMSPMRMPVRQSLSMANPTLAPASSGDYDPGHKESGLAHPGNLFAGST